MTDERREAVDKLLTEMAQCIVHIYGTTVALWTSIQTTPEANDKISAGLDEVTKSIRTMLDELAKVARQ